MLHCYVPSHSLASSLHVTAINIKDVLFVIRLRGHGRLFSCRRFGGRRRRRRSCRGGASLRVARLPRAPTDSPIAHYTLRVRKDGPVLVVQGAARAVLTRAPLQAQGWLCPQPFSRTRGITRLSYRSCPPFLVLIIILRFRCLEFAPRLGQKLSKQPNSLWRAVSARAWIRRHSFSSNCPTQTSPTSCSRSANWGVVFGASDCGVVFPTALGLWADLIIKSLLSRSHTQAAKEGEQA